MKVSSRLGRTLCGTLCGTVAACGLAAVGVSAQGSTYKVPHTPWGDPDLQGNYTVLSEAGTPIANQVEIGW